MGSLFKKGKEVRGKGKAASPRPYSPVLPPPAPREVIDPKAPMRSPAVDLKGKLPKEVADRLDEQVEAGARGLLLDPEEQETRIFAFFEDRLVELGRTPVAGHTELLYKVNACRDGAIEVAGRRYRLEPYTAFSDFGDRLVVQFFEEGKFTDEQAVERKKDNIRLVNRLKPATSLTWKNQLDIFACIQKNPRPTPFHQILLQDGLVDQEKLDRLAGREPFELAVLQEYVYPRKAAASALARYLGVEYVDVEEVAFSKPAARLLPKDWELEKQVVPFAQSGDELKVAMMDPTDSDLIAEIQERTRLKVKAYCSAAQDIMVMVHKAHKKED
ncbi:MAG TPA: hypothetical protein VNO81_00420 [Candidatus Nitrosotenuis sp.]|nr:hypothetical protein [Candidatus Nitrosotenuis sp.]